ncbi:MAG: HK97-gp10 family putative phage morphogenesis protein [Bacilli bacterium]
MADFKFSLDMDSIFPQGLGDENLALDMVKAGQVVMQKSIQRAAQKHVKTGSMVNSVKCSKPVINRAGDAVGRVKFYGKDKNGMPNWSKALWCEFGAKNQPAQPFVRPAIKSCESSIKAAMQKVFTQKTKR